MNITVLVGSLRMESVQKLALYIQNQYKSKAQFNFLPLG